MESAWRTRRLLHHCLARRKGSALRAAMAAWHSEVESRRAFRAQLQEMVDMRGAQLLRGAFRAWREAAAACRAQRVSRLPSLPRQPL